MYVMMGFHFRSSNVDNFVRCEDCTKELPAGFKGKTFPLFAYETDDDRLRLLFLPLFVQLLYPIDHTIKDDGTNFYYQRQYSNALTPVPVEGHHPGGTNLAYHQLQLIDTQNQNSTMSADQEGVVAISVAVPPDPFCGRVHAQNEGVYNAMYDLPLTDAIDRKEKD